uniref:EF-hand domain-containing protein n=1 Tax=Acrobeloides nanus TaxID=290746 RepID=A0A914DVY1_9BILA
MNNLIQNRSHGEGEPSKNLLPESEIRQAFEQCDESGVGLIPVKKLKIVMRAVGFEPRQNEVDALMEKLVRSKAREVNPENFTVEEFVALIQDRLQEDSGAKEISEAFKLFDTENKGFITMADLRRVAKELGEELKDTELLEMVQAASSQPNHITEDDFKIIMKRTALY